MEMKSQIESVTYEQLHSELYQHSENINFDQEYWFQLRGQSINPMIDSATPLFGMVFRVRKMESLPDVKALYHQAVNEVIAAELELSGLGYDRAEVLAFRYMLCSFVDESVMLTHWGTESIWAEHSLLTRFHNETWGGEKVFGVLQRLEEEPSRYKHLLEFAYVCFCLGFEGRYRVIANGREEFDKILGRLYETLRQHEEEEPKLLPEATDHVVQSKYRLGKQIPVWSVFSGFLMVLASVFFIYTVSLSTKSNDVLKQLHQILN